MAVLLATALLLLSCLACAAESWELAYFHDEDDSSLSLTDIAFGSAQRGIAVGSIRNSRLRKATPVALVTSDGGKSWDTVETKEVGLSLFVLDETAGWMVTRSGVWFTEESGRTWTRVLKQDGLIRVYFLDRQRGWALGTRKKVLHTTDGGSTWSEVPETKALTTHADRTSFMAISFADQRLGMITGSSRGRNPGDDQPLWMEEEPDRRPERPSLSITLVTGDGGKSWRSSAASMFGAFTDLELLQDSSGVALIQFERYFFYPSEVFRIRIDPPGADRILRRRDVAVTSIAVKDGVTYAAGFQPAGRLATAPIPGRLRMLASKDGVEWSEAAVDYRAVANQVKLAKAGTSGMWAATDTGMILHLRQE